MLLKNLMEEKQLNFDQPFLSVRRVHASPPSVTSQKRENRRIDSYSYQVRPQLPTYKSELKSGPIRNPGAVPFLWEHSPGQPKEETNRQIRTSEKPPIAPMLPPGRNHPKAKQDVSRVVSRWTTRSRSVEAESTSEEKKQDVSVAHESRADENVKNVESSKGGSDSGDSNEAYVDARDTLSRTEYSFLNCSMSGLSGAEDFDSRPRERLPADPQAREFMMDRFLPAAKAMASETPHAPKKQPVQPQQQPRKTANQCGKPSLRYGPSFAKKYSHYNESEEEGEDESDDEYDQRANLPSVCGLLPRFCLKSSLGRLSPVPAMSVRTRGRTKSSSSGSYTEMENESISDRTEVKSINKIQTAELDEDKATLRSEDGQEARPDHEGTPHSKGLKTFEEFLHDRGISDQSSSGDLTAEKTVYVDTVHKVESPKLVEEMHATGSPLGDVKKPRDFGENRDFEMDLTRKEDKLALTVYNSGLPAPPPLPKSPSDSWLGRTLPSMGTKGSSLRPFLGSPESNCLKASAGDMKWETIVKTTKGPRRHMHFSEESLTTIPEA